MKGNVAYSSVRGYQRPAASRAAGTAIDEPNTITGSPSHRLARNAFFMLVGQVASSVLSVILTAVLGRWLGVVEFGIYYYLVAASTFAYVFIDWGQSTYLTRIGAASRGR